jgi:hypothetical protein
MGKLSNTWALLKASWEILKKDKEMLLFPVMSGIACILFLAAFLVPLVLLVNEDPKTRSPEVLIYLCFFVYLFFTYFVMTFFNAALVACAAKRMVGGDPTIGDGIRTASSRLHPIAGWALLSASLGVILKVIEDRSEWVGKIVSDVIGIAWGIASYLVVPVLVLENRGPLEALRESAALVKKTWGEQFIGGFSFAIVYILSCGSRLASES